MSFHSESGAGESSVSRRHFLQLALGTGAAVGVLSAVGMDSTGAAEPAIPSTIPTRLLGRTGERVSCLGLGGAHLGRIKEDEECTRLLRLAVDNGITFMDNCWDYNNGTSEMRMGRALRDGYRDKVFLMSKIDGRDKKTAARQIDESLLRLQTDHIDLMQHHEIIRMDDADRIFAEGGAHEAFLEAKAAGKIRYMGFTGHKDPQVFLRMFEVAGKHNVRFDAVQMPLNVMDAHFRSFEKTILPILVRDRIGVLGMKSMGSGVILKSNVVTATECLHYALNLPTSVVITGIDKPEILDQALAAARTFKPLSTATVAALLARTKEAAVTGKYELFKTSDRFDGTIRHPEWMGRAEST